LDNRKSDRAADAGASGISRDLVEGFLTASSCLKETTMRSRGVVFNNRAAPLRFLEGTPRRLGLRAPLDAM